MIVSLYFWDYVGKVVLFSLVGIYLLLKFYYGVNLLAVKSKVIDSGVID
jgi:hypothetical protein